ncbi:transposase [Archangium gephyra]|uniref:transposase n=1 Tax=Archangium gephyra TaxID=48 RepID=UPI003B761689
MRSGHATAAHLTKQVLPYVPYRQWTLSFPHRVRWVLLKDVGLVSDVLTLFLRAVFALQRRRARRQGLRGGQVGAVSFIQFFGSALQVTPHFHSLVPDGVFVPREGGVCFEPLPPPTQAEVERLLRVVRHRVLRLLEKRGALPAQGPEDARQAYQAHSLRQRLRWTELDVRPPPRKQPRCAFLEGFSLHANTHLHANDWQGLERLCPYGARGALALERLSRAEDGRIAYRMKRPLPDGTTHLLFTELEFLRRVASLVPPPRANLTRFHGVFAPGAHLRPFLVPQAGEEETRQGARPRHRGERHLLPLRPLRPSRRSALRRRQRGSRPRTVGGEAGTSRPVTTHDGAEGRMIREAVEQFRTRAVELSRHVGGPHHVTFEPLWEAVSREPPIPLEVEGLTEVREALRGLEPLPRLLSCLLLLRWLGGAPGAASWPATFTRDAATAIYDLGRAELFPFRIFILDGLLSTVTHPVEGAELLFLRGNTALQLSSWDATWHEHAVRDLRAAAELGRSLGHVLTEVQAEGALVRAALVRRMGGPPASLEELEQKVAALSSLLPRAEPIDLASDIHELLADLEALRAQQGQPQAGRRAIQHARRALEDARSPRLKTARLATLAQMLLLHGTPDEAPEAMRLARESVGTLPAEAGPLLAVAPLMGLGLVLLRSNMAAEAVQHLEHALALQARQQPSANRDLCRIHLAQAYLALARPSDAAHQLELGLRDARAIGDLASVLDATRLLVELDWKGGRDELAEARLREAEALLEGTAGQTLLALERLRPRRHGEVPSAELLQLLRDRLSGRVRSNAVADELFQGVVANHATELPGDLRRQLLDEGARLVVHPSIRARLLAAEGRAVEAVGLLRDLLSQSTEPRERLQAAALLLVFLPRQADEERLRCCDVVEELLEGPLDHAATRYDLAAALTMCSQDRPELIERAMRHADRAAPQLEGDPGTREVTTRLRAKLRFNQIVLGVGGSSVALAGQATWFENRLSLPGPELAELRCDVARGLLASGPLAHPEALSVAERLLGLVPPDGDAPGLLARLRWIRARIASPEASTQSLPPPTLRGPFDEVPAWAISLVQGTAPQGLTAPESRGFDAVFVIARVRPDRAEAVLIWLTGLDASEEVLEAIASVAGSAPRASVQPLMDLVEKMAGRNTTFPLLHLRVLLYHHSLEWGEGSRYQRAADALLAAARTPEERIEALVQKGIERMNAFRAHPHDDEQGRAVTRAARDAMAVALDEARRLQFDRKELFSLLVFAGNAFRTGVEPDVARALALYEEAERFGAPSPWEEARLGRVLAETLLERGGSGDARRALEWVERSLKVRKEGYLRVESLLTAARAELLVAEGSEPVRLRRSLERLDEAERIAEKHQLRDITHKQVIVLAKLVRCSPGETALKRRLEELARRHPEFAEDIERAMHGVEGPLPRDMMEDIGHAMSHPALRRLTEAIGPLSPRDLKMMEEMGRRLNADPATMRRLLEQYAKEDRSPQALRKHADRFIQVQDPQERPGAAVGRARLLAHVVEDGLARAEEVRTAAEEAEQLARQVKDPQVRGRLLVELAPVWAPRDHARHPVRDFRRAAEMAREVREAAAAGSETSRLALQILARATHYRTDGDIAAHWREAEQLYEQCVAEYEAAGLLDVAANARSNLEELRTARRGGDQEASMRDGLAAARERVARAGSPEQEASARLNLAVTLTIQGAQIPGERGRAMLTEARTEFERIDRSLLSRSDKEAADNYGTICRADLAELRGQRQEAIELWRARLDSLAPDAPDLDRAYTLHNLADMLMRPGSFLPQVLEGLDLSERSLQVRTLAEYPQHHWETCENIGRTAAGLLAPPRKESPGILPSPGRCGHEAGRP